jgi:hypothetical protein
MAVRMAMRLVARLGGAAFLVGTLAHAWGARAFATDCGELPAQLAQDPTHSSAFAVLDSAPLYRYLPKPYVRLPQGVRIRLRPPAGVTLADLHRAAVCGARADSSPLAVPGGKVRVSRWGGDYQLFITSDDLKTAREIQRRAGL